MIVIGGAACEDYFDSVGLAFRATHDIDIVLLVEQIDDRFLRAFWDFIRMGDYEIDHSLEGKVRFYRFKNPKKEDFPKMLELFSRSNDKLRLPENLTAIPISVSEEISSLSALVMDDDYYELLRNNIHSGNLIHRANELVLIVLKIKAFLDLRRRRLLGDGIDERQIKKHRGDIFRIGATLTDDHLMGVTRGIRNDIDEFLEIIGKNPPDIKGILKSMGVTTAIPIEEITGLLDRCFSLE
jgi:hypothetical protein